MLTRLARMLARRSAQARRHGPRRESRSAVDRIIVVMQNRDGQLHAEGDQRQADQSETCSRCCHQVLKLFPAGPRRDPLTSSVLVSPSWRPARADIAAVIYRPARWNKEAFSRLRIMEESGIC